VQCDNPYDTRYRPERIIIYDKQPGGIGIAQAVRQLLRVYKNVLGEGRRWAVGVGGWAVRGCGGACA